MSREIPLARSMGPTQPSSRAWSRVSTPTPTGQLFHGVVLEEDVGKPVHVPAELLHPVTMAASVSSATSRRTPPPCTPRE